MSVCSLYGYADCTGIANPAVSDVPSGAKRTLYLATRGAGGAINRYEPIDFNATVAAARTRSLAAVSVRDA